MKARERLDRLMVDRGLAETRNRAQALIMAGRVRVEGRPVTKAGTAIPPDPVSYTHLTLPTKLEV